jgi:CPA2 family monovalent cation:H+ antiporter-2
VNPLHFPLAIFQTAGKGESVETHANPLEYKELLVILVAAGVVIPLFHRLGVSSVLGFLLTGILIGPAMLGQLFGDYPWLRHFTIERPEDVKALAELGVAFLLFMIGIELTFERLMTMRRLVFGLGGMQIAASAAIIGLLIYLAGFSPKTFWSRPFAVFDGHRHPLR